MTTETLPTVSQPAPAQHLRLARWSASMGSNVQCRGSVIIESGEHRWQGAAKGSGPVDALFRAVDLGLREVLGGHPRLLAYDVHALHEGPDAEGRVTVRVAPPENAPPDRNAGSYEAVAQGTNIIAASIEAYIAAIELFLAEEQWAGATEAAGNGRAAARGEAAPVEYDGHARPDQTRWWT